MILFNDTRLELKKFPNGETNITKEFLDNKRNEKLHMGKDRFTLKYQSDEDLFQLLLLRKAVWFPVELEIPYFPYSRMDRKSASHVFTLKTVCKFINWLEFDQVWVYEPHSDVTPALLNKCRVVTIVPQLLTKAGYNPKKDFVLYPDAGAHKKYADLIKAPRELTGFKKRNFATGRIASLEIYPTQLGGASTEDAKVFIVDDLCSKGGTFVLAAAALAKTLFHNINLVVAHCEPSIYKGEIFTSNLIDHVYTTDTIPRDDTSEKLTSYNYQSV